jgi:hypothetical protein
MTLLTMLLPGALVLLLGLAAIPLHVRFRLDFRGRLRRSLRLAWGFGLVRLKFEGGTAPASAPTDGAGSSRTGESTERTTAQSAKEPPTPAAERRAEPGTESPSERSTSPGNATRYLAPLRVRAFRRRVLRFARDCWKALRARVDLRARIGLGDPADTGELWALLGPLSALLGMLTPSSIIIEPEFDDATFEFHSSGELRVIPLQFAWLVLSLACSPGIWRGVRAATGPARA